MAGGGRRGLRLTAVVPGGGGWERGAAAVQGESEVAKQTASCPARRIVPEPACSLCGTRRACCRAMLPAPPHSSLSAPHRAGGSQSKAPSKGEALVFSPPSLPPLSDVISPFGLVPSSCSHFPALLPPCQPWFPCSADISWWFCCFAGGVRGRRTPQTFLGKQARDEGDPQSGKNYWRKIC